MSEVSAQAKESKPAASEEIEAGEEEAGASTPVAAGLADGRTVNRSAKLLKQTGTRNDRQRIFRSIQAKYGNQYASRVARTYQQSSPTVIARDTPAAAPSDAGALSNYYCRPDGSGGFRYSFGANLVRQWPDLRWPPFNTYVHDFFPLAGAEDIKKLAKAVNYDVAIKSGGAVFEPSKLNPKIQIVNYTILPAMHKDVCTWFKQNLSMDPVKPSSLQEKTEEDINKAVDISVQKDQSFADTIPVFQPKGKVIITNSNKDARYLKGTNFSATVEFMGGDLGNAWVNSRSYYVNFDWVLTGNDGKELQKASGTGTKDFSYDLKDEGSYNLKVSTRSEKYFLQNPYEPENSNYSFTVTDEAKRDKEVFDNVLDKDPNSPLTRDTQGKLVVKPGKAPQAGSIKDQIKYIEDQIEYIKSHSGAGKELSEDQAANALKVFEKDLEDLKARAKDLEKDFGENARTYHLTGTLLDRSNSLSRPLSASLYGKTEGENDKFKCKMTLVEMTISPEKPYNFSGEGTGSSAKEAELSAINKVKDSIISYNDYPDGSVHLAVILTDNEVWEATINTENKKKDAKKYAGYAAMGFGAVALGLSAFDGETTAPVALAMIKVGVGLAATGAALTEAGIRNYENMETARLEFGKEAALDTLTVVSSVAGMGGIAKGLQQAKAVENLVEGSKNIHYILQVAGGVADAGQAIVVSAKTRDDILRADALYAVKIAQAKTDDEKKALEKERDLAQAAILKGATVNLGFFMLGAAQKGLAAADGIGNTKINVPDDPHPGQTGGSPTHEGPVGQQGAPANEATGQQGGHTNETPVKEPVKDTTKPPEGEVKPQDGAANKPAADAEAKPQGNEGSNNPAGNEHGPVAGQDQNAGKPTAVGPDTPATVPTGEAKVQPVTGAKAGSHAEADPVQKQAAIDQLNQGNHPDMASLKSGDEGAIKKLLNTMLDWKTLLGNLQKGGATQQEIGQALLAYRKKIIDQMKQFLGAPLGSASTEWISDVDINHSGDNAGANLLAAEKWLRENVGENWAEMLRMSLFTDTERMGKYQEVQGLMDPAQQKKMFEGFTSEAELYNTARQLQYAAKNPEMLATVKELAAKLGIDIEAAQKLANQSPEESRTRRDQLMLKIDGLMKDFKAAQDPKEKARIGQEITKAQIEANFYTPEAYIDPGANKQVVPPPGGAKERAAQLANQVNDLQKAKEQATTPEEKTRLENEIRDRTSEQRFYEAKAQQEAAAAGSTDPKGEVKDAQPQMKSAPPKSNSGKLNPFEAYGAALSHYTEMMHIIKENGGELLKAAREYEFWKYVSRFVQAAKEGGISGADLDFFENLSNYLYKISRDAHTENPTPVEINQAVAKGQAASAKSGGDTMIPVPTDANPQAGANGQAVTQPGVASDKFIKGLTEEFQQRAMKILPQLQQNAKNPAPAAGSTGPSDKVIINQPPAGN